MTTATTNNTSSSGVYDAINKSSSSLSKTKSTSQVTETQDRFLKLLTTQLKNQDPLNPMDNAQMTSQMAQISTVDGITKLNATLDKLITANSDSQTLQAAALVGHAVLVPGNSVKLGANGAVAGLELAGPADQVEVTIKDSNGLVVRTLNLGAMETGSHAIQWDGKSNSGADAAQGNYTFTVSAVQGGKDVTTTALSAGLVSGVVRAASGMTLDVDTLGSFKLSDVRQIL